MTDGSDADDEPGLDLFQEPEGYYPPSKQPTFVQHRMLDGRELQLRLVGHNPLWGHHLWQAGRIISNYLEQHATELRIPHASVLELGAGAGLPSLICALHGASSVLVTDYPDADLIENLRHNIEHCSLLQQERPFRLQAQGYLWGAPVSTLLIDDAADGFDLLILADLLFNHSEHAKLLATVRGTLKPSPQSRALVFFTPYRPWLLDKDMAFFDLARAGGLVVEKILETIMEKVMFEEDRGVSLLPVPWMTGVADVDRMSCCAGRYLGIVFAGQREMKQETCEQSTFHRSDYTCSNDRHVAMSTHITPGEVDRSLHAITPRIPQVIRDPVMKKMQVYSPLKLEPHQFVHSRPSHGRQADDLIDQDVTLCTGVRM